MVMIVCAGRRYDNKNMKERLGNYGETIFKHNGTLLGRE